MLKRKLRKWLGLGDIDTSIYELQNTDVCFNHAFTLVREDYARLENMYDSNRMRIDNLVGRLDKAEALIVQLKLVGLPKAIEAKRKPKKIVTTKKGK